MDVSLDEDDPDRLGSRVSAGRAPSLSRCWVLVPALLAATVVGATWIAWERRHPAAPASRALHNRVPAQRIAAVRELERFGREDPDVAIPALTGALRDANAEVRAAAAVGLIMVVPSAARDDVAFNHVQPAMDALFAALRDPDGRVRAAAAQALASIGGSGRAASARWIRRPCSRF